MDPKHSVIKGLPCSLHSRCPLITLGLPSTLSTKTEQPKIWELIGREHGTSNLAFTAKDLNELGLLTYEIVERDIKHFLTSW